MPEQQPRVRHVDLRHLELVDLDGTAAPKRFTATIELAGCEATLELELDDENVPRCRALAVRAGEVTDETLREIHVAELAALALAEAARPYEPSAPGVVRMPIFPAPADRERAYERFVEGARRPRQGSRVDDETLSQVADLYRAAVAAGDPPTAMIGKTMNASRSTAARWVTKARERGFLGPALRGRAGEAG